MITQKDIKLILLILKEKECIHLVMPLSDCLI